MYPYFAGHASRSINPTLPVPLAGYDVKRIANDIHDSLSVKAVILQDAKDQRAKTVIISLDTLTVDEAFTKRIASRLMRYGFERHQIILAATHTHSGPSGLANTERSILAGMHQVFGIYDEAYMKYCVEQIEWAVYDASQNMQEANVLYFEGDLIGISGERHFRSKEIFHERNDTPDQNLESVPVSCIEIRFSCFQPVLIYSFACHPTILNASNLSISADLCYGIEQVLTSKDKTPSKASNENKNKNQYGMILFLNGAAGDQSTRPVRHESTFEEVIRLGELVASQLQLILSDDAKQVDSLETTLPLISTKVYEYPVSLIDMPTQDEANQQLQLAQHLLLKKQKEVPGNQWQKVRRVYESHVEGAKIRTVMAEHLELDNVVWSITKLQIGSITVVTIPGELYSSLARQIKLSQGFVCGYTNGYYLYIVDETGYEEQDYEAMMSPYEKGEGERLVHFLNEVVLKD